MFYCRYSREDAVGDLVAGITVGLTVIPQALAYSGVAGLPPAVSFINISRSKFILNYLSIISTVRIVRFIFGMFHIHFLG